jgi:hypothetical protein
MNSQMEIRQFREIELSDDGAAVIVTAELAGESVARKWNVPYRHAIWVAKAILSVAHQAVQRQVAGGTIEPTTIAGDALQVETLELLVKPKEERAAIAAVGTWTSNSAPGNTALLVDKSTAQVLIDQLQQFVQVAQTVSRPS